MFENARSLVFSDRSKARKALADEIKRNERAELDADLDTIEADERKRLADEQAKATAAQQVVEAQAALKDVKKKQNGAAVAFDDAMRSANDAFERLEVLSTQAARLERDIGASAGQPPVNVGHARSAALVAAIWNSARPLAKSVGLAGRPPAPHETSNPW